MGMSGYFSFVLIIAGIFSNAFALYRIIKVRRAMEPGLFKQLLFVSILVICVIILQLLTFKYETL